jgi:hypothetical protein
VEGTLITVLGTIIVALITAVGTITNTIISKKTNKKVDCVAELKKDFKEHILDADKTNLIIFLSELELGMEKTDIQKKRAYEIYERYTENGGNSYVHDKWEEVKKKGLL